MTGSGFNGGADAARQAWDKGLVGPGAPVPPRPKTLLREDGCGMTREGAAYANAYLRGHTITWFLEGLECVGRDMVAGDLWPGGRQCVVGPCPFCDGGRA